jgi:hypothetical protein
MKKLFIPLITLVFFFYQSSAQKSSAQTRDGDLKMVKSFGGTKFYLDGQLLKPKEVLNLMEHDVEAFNEFKKAKSNNDAGNVLGFIGGVMIGWPLGTALAGGDPQWGLAAGGAAVLVATIPLTIGFKKHATTATNLYNRNTSNVSADLRPKVNMGLHGTGARLVITF